MENPITWAKLAVVTLVILGTAACGKPDTEQRGAELSACEGLVSLELSDTKIALAESVDAGTFESMPLPRPANNDYDYSDVPAFCRVLAVVEPVEDSSIEFEVWLPEDWNGGFVGVGDGGFTGAVFHDRLAEPLKRGYAVANTDGGHKGGPSDASFAVGHPEKMIDHAWRAVHLMTVRSKEIVAAHYGRPADRALWTGCSTGGRQGLKAAQRFPADYDAIAAMAPASNWVPLMAHSIFLQQQFERPDGALDPAKMALIKTAALASCDANDGVIDTVINDPRSCDFDPAVLECAGDPGPDCLLPHEVDAVRRIYAGVTDPETGDVLYPGAEPGSELEWPIFQSGVFPIGENYARDIVFPEREWDIHAVDFGADIEAGIEREFAGMAARNPDLSAFSDEGGKLLLYHGWIDGLITPQDSINYYESVLAEMGQDAVDQFMRFYLLPGVAHCVPMEGPGKFDVLGTLEAWLDSGTPPERIVASRTLEGGATRTRPLCPYPRVARYSGSGSTDDAANFECVAP